VTLHFRFSHSAWTNPPALLDVLDEEFNRGQHLVLKFALVLLGLGSMAVLAVWT
jgi:hypothetical protein